MLSNDDAETQSIEAPAVSLFFPSMYHHFAEKVRLFRAGNNILLRHLACTTVSDRFSMSVCDSRFDSRRARRGATETTASSTSGSLPAGTV